MAPHQLESWLLTVPRLVVRASICGCHERLKFKTPGGLNRAGPKEPLGIGDAHPQYAVKLIFEDRSVRRIDQCAGIALF
ncbi:hypothetical protein GV68_21615 [Pseudorhizobium pelagicum]|uniref:Uncharacterized protein n=1 Tax=Pseudorhizobium pelagicum TaxID=1509405 RepID=A0A922TA77_9HYPH|nr:hypothetical protein GV68_21615 [Pseudorhizobium pelagicum]